MDRLADMNSVRFACLSNLPDGLFFLLLNQRTAEVARYYYVVARFE